MIFLLKQNAHKHKNKNKKNRKHKKKGVPPVIFLRFRLASVLFFCLFVCFHQNTEYHRSKKFTPVCQVKIYRITVIKMEKCFTINSNICQLSIFTYRQLLKSCRKIDYSSSPAFFFTEINITKIKRREIMFSCSLSRYCCTDSKQ